MIEPYSTIIAIICISLGRSGIFAINYLFDWLFSVIKQPYNVQVYGEYAIAGNTGHLKCQIPAFVREYVYVTAWLKGDTILATDRTSKGKCQMDCLKY